MKMLTFHYNRPTACFCVNSSTFIAHYFYFITIEDALLLLTQVLLKHNDRSLDFRHSLVLFIKM